MLVGDQITTYHFTNYGKSSQQSQTKKSIGKYLSWIHRVVDFFFFSWPVPFHVLLVHHTSSGTWDWYCIEGILPSQDHGVGMECSPGQTLRNTNLGQSEEKMKSCFLDPQNHQFWHILWEIKSRYRHSTFPQNLCEMPVTLLFSLFVSASQNVRALSHSVVFGSATPWTRPLCPGDSPGKNIGVALPSSRGSFWSQGSNPVLLCHLLHW